LSETPKYIPKTQIPQNPDTQILPEEEARQIPRFWDLGQIPIWPLLAGRYPDISGYFGSGAQHCLYSRQQSEREREMNYRKSEKRKRE
jgi:hypothetical protein